MKLILSGGGDEKQSKGVDSLFVKNLKNDKILYIPVAMDQSKISYPDCFEWCSSNLSKYGDFEIDMWIEEDLPKKSYSDINTFGGVFIGGGNTFHLLKEFRSSDFGDKLVRLLSETEIPVIGGSAGATIFAKSIETAVPYDENSVGLKDLEGYNQINGYNIWVHYESNMDNLIVEYTEKLYSKIIAIPEDSGIFFDGDKILVVGENNVKVFPEDKVFIKDERIIFKG